MDEEGLYRGLEQLIELANSVAVSSRVYRARQEFYEQMGYPPTYLVVAHDLYLSLLVEAQTLMGAYTFFDKDSKLSIFGMEIEVANLPDGEFFVGDKQ